MGAAADFDDHRLAPANRRRLAHETAAEDIARAALEPAFVAEPCLAARHLQGHARGDAAAGRTAIDLAAGEDADVAARAGGGRGTDGRGGGGGGGEVGV